MERKRKIPVVVIFILPILVIAFFRDISNVDELWNYTFANNINNGLLPYRDFNLLQTPFSCLLNALFIQIFGKHLLAIRLAGAVLFWGVSVLLYKICRYMGAGRIEGTIVPLGFLLMFYWDVFFEYNILVLMLLLFGMFFDIYVCHYQRPLVGFRRKGGASAKGSENLFTLQHVFVGILMGLAILSKQTYGFFVAAGSCLSGIWTQYYICLQNKGEKVKKGRLFKAFLLRIVGIAIPCCIFLGYLLFTDTVDNFLDMCLFGISEFSGVYAYTTFMMENAGYFIGGVLFPVLVVACMIYMLRKDDKGTGKRQKLGVLLLYGITGCISLYPLANSYHVALSAVPFLPALFLLLPPSLFVKKPIRILKWTAFTVALIVLIFILPIVDCKDRELCSLKHFEFTFIKKEKKEEIEQIHSFIKETKMQGTNVYILDNFAVLYFIPLDKYHNGLDMFLLGNLGTRSPKDWIKEAEEPAAIFIVPGEGRGNWQFPYDDLNEMKKDWKYLKSISNFDVYSVQRE